MRDHHLLASAKRMRKATTRPGRDGWRAADLVKQNFGAVKLNRKRTRDSNETGTGEGKLHSSRLLTRPRSGSSGFAVSQRHDAQLAYRALTQRCAAARSRLSSCILARRWFRPFQRPDRAASRSNQPLRRPGGTGPSPPHGLSPSRRSIASMKTAA
jgi:hypothetical protein